MTERAVVPRTVGEVATLEPIVVTADAPLIDAVTLMTERRISGLPVVDAGGRLVGVISQTDLTRLRTTHHLWEHWAGLSVRHLMSTPPLTVRVSTPLVSAAREMESAHIHRLVVVADDDPNLPIGVISTTDLVRALADEERP
jgi:CBS domain-containing protein